MFRLTHRLLISSLLTLYTLSPTLGQEVKKAAPDKTQIVTASVTADGVRIAAPSAVEQLRLEVYDDAGQKLLDTEQSGANLDWHLQGNAGERVADGTYLLVVTIRNPGGQLSQKLGLVTVSAQSTTLRAAAVTELSPQQAQVVGPIEGGAEGLAVVGTQNKVAKWTDGAGTLGDGAVYESGGLVVIGQNASGQVAPLAPISGQYHTLEVGVPPGVKSPLTLAGGSGVMEFWKDLGGGIASPAAAVSFGMAVPGTPATNDMVFSTVTPPSAWNERMRVTTAGNVGIGTNNPGAKLDVAGNIKLSGANSSLIFPDGTSMTTAGSGAMSGTSIVSAVNNAATVGTINDNRLSPNLAHLNSANTFNGNQTVNGAVQSTSGGFIFPDGSVQNSAAGRAYTTLASTDLEVRPAGSVSSSIIDVNLFPGNYLLTATIQVENRADLVFQNNTRSMNCTFVPGSLNYPTGSVNYPVWNVRLGGAGSSNDKLPVTFTQVIVQSVSPFATVSLFCGVEGGNTDRSYVFAKTRRLTAVRLGDFEPQP